LLQSDISSRVMDKESKTTHISVVLFVIYCLIRSDGRDEIILLEI
jgi:hypothetical protein